MAITARPKRNLTNNPEARAEAFISGASKHTSKPNDGNKLPVMIRVDPELLAMIDVAAKRRHLSRSAFIVTTVVEQLERGE
jgi:hypothetical protein